MAGKPRKKKIPQLKYSELRNIGWHVSFRDPSNGLPRKHRFKVSSQEEAEAAYHKWIADFLQGTLPEKGSARKRKSIIEEPEDTLGLVEAEMVQGSLLHVTSSLLRYEESRVRPDGETRRKGTISRSLFADRKHYSKEFLSFINSQYGAATVCSMCLPDLSMDDVEEYNRRLVKAGYSASQVTKRLRFVKSIIDRAGRPEFGTQAISWNWASLDILHGKPAQSRMLPTLKQVKLILKNCEIRERAIVWIAIGCGFGQRDIAAMRLNDMDKTSYDLRRGKTGIQRYGDTPKLVWNSLNSYLSVIERDANDLIFTTRKGMPLVHGNSDAVYQWWSRLRERLGEDCKSLDGFYILRHLGATEYGSRPGCSVGDMKRWLGHSASSHMADVYMKPVSPEDRPVVEWVRKSLNTGKADLTIKSKKT